MAIPSNCSGCGREFGTGEGQVSWTKAILHNDGSSTVFCRGCYSTPRGVPDVFIGNGNGVMYEENIADPKTGKPIPFYDKRSKLAAMKQAGVREAGDRKHGMRNEEMWKYRRKHDLIDPRYKN